MRWKNELAGDMPAHQSEEEIQASILPCLDDLSNPYLIELLEYYRSLCPEDGHHPHIDRFRPQVLAKHLSNICLIELQYNNDGSFKDCLYRVAGTDFCVMLGYELTGTLLSDFAFENRRKRAIRVIEILLDRSEAMATQSPLVRSGQRLLVGQTLLLPFVNHSNEISNIVQETRIIEKQ
jgi:hypothetical protein